MRKSAERAAQAMIAVARATKNAEMVAREAKLRAEGKLKSFDGPIKEARKSAVDAGKAVEHARAALSATLGTKARIAARHALIRAKGAVADANMILKSEIGKANEITSNRLQSDGARLIGENELHYKARKMFHRANRVLKLVNTALDHARENHYAHREAVMKQQNKMSKEKGAKLAHKEARAKSEARRKALGIKTKQQYAARLAAEALKAGESAKHLMTKAAKFGQQAAKDAMESAEVKAELYKSKHKGVVPAKKVAFMLQNEAHSAYLASRASQLENVIAAGQQIPHEVQALLGKGDIASPEDLTANSLQASRAAEQQAASVMPSDHQLQSWVKQRADQKLHYKKLFLARMAAFQKAHPEVGKKASTLMEATTAKPAVQAAKKK
jgi:hypothetical protein